ncbi:hypothetical protein PRIC2_001680 [Phytophthora ramorum]
METMLQHTLAAAEKLHSFHFLNALLRSLVFNNHADTDNVESEPFLQPLSLHAKTLWALPNVASSAGLRGVNTAQLQYQSNSDSAPIFQHVVAAFLDDMLSSLGYMDNLEGAQQLHAMVKFVLPALSSTIVARQILGIEAEDSSMTDVAVSGRNDALRELLTKTRAYLPHSVLTCVQMLTALCCNYKGVSSPGVLRQVLKYFNKPRAGLEEHMIRRTGIVRQLPPEEYFSVTAGEIERVQCTRSFAYEDGEDRLAVPAGTIGTVWRSTDGVQVEWLLADTEGKNEPSLWDLLTLSADSFVAGLQSGSFADLHRTDAEDASVLAAFFEFIVQLGQQHDGGQFDLGELERRWGEARLRRWWMDRRLPSPEVHVNQLVRQQIALPMLLSASRENLVSWGIRDRYTRELILVQLGSGDSIAYANTVTDGSIDSFGVDGGTHLLRLLLGVLDGFVHAGANDNAMMDGESAWSTARLHLVAASFLALSTLLATTTGVDLLMRSSVGGGQEECVNLIVKSAKKLFELQERLVGEYPVVLATHEIFLSVVRWFLSKEAQTLADSFGEGSVGSQAFIAMERLWFVGATEFAIEVLSTHESWKFTSTSERCEVKERCFRLLFVLVLPRKYVSERNDMIPAFEKALRETLSTDMSLLMKLLRSSCAVLSPMEGHVGHWNSIATTDNDANDASSSGEEDSNGHFPLVYETEFDSGGVDLVQLEALVTTCLRLLELLVANRTNSVDAQTVRKLLLTPIDDGGPKKRKSLTIVTLCGGYLDYSVEKAPGIAYWSLLILQHAAVVLDYRQERESRGLSSMHSLVALFHGNQDLPLVRGMFARLLRVSSPHHLALRKEVIEMLTLCLEHQPGFLALLLLGDDRKENSTSDERSEGAPLPFVALLERFFGASEQLLEQSSDLFCALLTFLVQVWKGAIHNGLAVHLKIMAALRERSTFWPNVTRALKIHMPLESVEERGLLDIELAAVTVQGRGGVGSSSESYTGRSSAYGYLARGLILQLVAYEWHNRASKQSDHPLVEVLDSFRKEGLYSHWLRTFTRLDYSPAQLEQYASSIRRACSLNTPTTNLLGDIPVGNISLYLEGLICDASALKWQLSAGGDIKLQASPADVRALKLVQWSNLQAAFLHAQLFSLTKWKVFMELCCLQAGGGSESPLEKAAEPTTPRRLKRKESMISSPPRSTVMNSTASSGSTSRLRVTMSASSASSSESALSSSRFSGDRTSFGMIQEVLDSFGSVDAPLTSKPKLCMANAVQLNPFVKELEHDQQGIGALFHLLVQRFRPSSYSKEVATRQEEACQVLRGLAAVVWNPENAELCQRVMLNNGSSRSSSRLRLLSMLATQLLPLLQAQMEREEATSSLRGYVVSASDEMETEDKGLDRSLAHRMWCLVLDFVGGLLRLQVEATGANFDDADVWDFMSHAEALLLAAVEPTTCQRLTRAVISEHQALLRLLSALSGNASRRKRWRQAFPSNSVVLMEQSRQLLRRACVLLGSSSAEISRLRKEKSQKQKATKSPSSKSLVSFGVSLTPKSPRSPRSPSAFTYAHQTLLHDHLQAVRDVEKRKLTDFHREMETQLVEIVRLASLLLTKWTGSLTDRAAILVVDGVRYVDEEQLMPLLAFIPASEARTMNSSPGLGHLTLAMDFMLDQLVASEDESQARKPMAVLASAIDVCALLFLKTYLLHAEQYELVKRDRDELSKFFRQFSGRLSGDDSGASVAVDAQLIQHIGKIIAG